MHWDRNSEADPSIHSWNQQRRLSGGQDNVNGPVFYIANNEEQGAAKLGQQTNQVQYVSRIYSGNSSDSKQLLDVYASFLTVWLILFVFHTTRD